MSMQFDRDEIERRLGMSDCNFDYRPEKMGVKAAAAAATGAASAIPKSPVPTSPRRRARELGRTAPSPRARTPPPPSSAGAKDQYRKLIRPTDRSRLLMRQMSGLGMEDPVFGTKEAQLGPSHPSQIFEDMSLNDVPPDMRDMCSIASDPTAQEGEGFDANMFHASLADMHTSISDFSTLELMLNPQLRKLANDGGVLTSGLQSVAEECGDDVRTDNKAKKRDSQKGRRKSRRQSNGDPNVRRANLKKAPRRSSNDASSAASPPVPDAPIEAATAPKSPRKSKSKSPSQKVRKQSVRRSLSDDESPKKASRRVIGSKNDQKQEPGSPRRALRRSISDISDGNPGKEKQQPRSPTKPSRKGSANGLQRASRRTSNPRHHASMSQIHAAPDLNASSTSQMYHASANLHASVSTLPSLTLSSVFQKKIGDIEEEPRERSSQESAHTTGSDSEIQSKEAKRTRGRLESKRTLSADSMLLEAAVAMKREGVASDDFILSVLSQSMADFSSKDNSTANLQASAAALGRPLRGGKRASLGAGRAAAASPEYQAPKPGAAPVSAKSEKRRTLPTLNSVFPGIERPPLTEPAKQQPKRGSASRIASNGSVKQANPRRRFSDCMDELKQSAHSRTQLKEEQNSRRKGLLHELKTDETQRLHAKEQQKGRKKGVLQELKTSESPRQKIRKEHKSKKKGLLMELQSSELGSPPFEERKRELSSGLPEPSLKAAKPELMIELDNAEQQQTRDPTFPSTLREPSLREPSMQHERTVITDGGDGQSIGNNPQDHHHGSQELDVEDELRGKKGKSRSLLAPFLGSHQNTKTSKYSCVESVASSG